MAKIVNGNLIANEIKNEVRKSVLNLNKAGIEVCLAVVVVGNNIASKIYVRNKARACESLKIKLKQFNLAETVSKEEFKNLIKALNSNNEINGILVQLPLPAHLNELEIFNLINPEKDVDGFCLENIGRLFLNRPCFEPCTAAGIVKILDYEKISLSGLNCVILGRSVIVGKPLSLMLINRGATVTVCCSKTVNVERIAKSADVLISSVGKARFVTGNFIKNGACVVDVGINRLENGKISGDVVFEEAEKKASLITPVPGGVGPLTVAKLMENVVVAAKLQNGIF